MNNFTANVDTFEIKSEFYSSNSEDICTVLNIKEESGSDLEEECLVYQPPPTSVYIPIQIDPLKDEPSDFGIKTEFDDDVNFPDGEEEICSDKISELNEESHNSVTTQNCEEIIHQKCSPASTYTNIIPEELLKKTANQNIHKLKTRRGKMNKIMKNKSLSKSHCSICKSDFADIGALSDHYHFSHPTLSGQLSVPSKDIHKNTLKKTCQKMQKCLKCKGRFFNKTDFDNHIDELGMCKFLNCKICGMIYADTDRLQIHMKRQHSILEKDFMFKCKYCDLEYNKQISLYKHMARKHSKISAGESDINQQCENAKRITCSKCKGQFDTESLYNSHLDDNSMCKLLSCNICGMIYTNTSNLHIHMKRKHDIVKGDFKFCCQYCGLEFMKKTTLYSHINVIHVSSPNKPLLYKCITCHAEFNLRNSLQKHIKRKHINHKSAINSIDTHICQYCGETYDTYSKLSNHFDTFHNSVSMNEHFDCDATSKVLEKNLYKDINNLHPLTTEVIESNASNDAVNKLRFKCEACNQKCKNLKALRSHVRRYHCSVKILEKKIPLEKFTCEYCGMTMTRRSLNKHIERKHAAENEIENCKTLDDKRHKCIYCDYRTDTKGNIKIHERIHTKEKPYICGIENCDHRAAHSTSIKLHRLTHDPAKNMLFCDHCNFKTINKYFFKMHYREHQSGGKKTYACKLCPYKTLFSSSYNHHKLKHADGKNFQCSLCFFSTKYMTSLKKHEKSKHKFHGRLGSANEMAKIDSNVTNWQEWFVD